MGKDVIIACDFGSGAITLDFLKGFTGKKPFVKIGMELFYSEGSEIVRQIKGMGHKIFLDLKLHDIPNTVMGGMRSLKALGADMLNLHAAGGSEMMKAAINGLGENRPLLIAVTQLTSTDERMLKEELYIEKGMKETVLGYAENASRSGLDGVVCSAHEAGEIKEHCGKGFITVTPGIRFADGNADDQKRIMTPAMAKEAGSDYIVVGRPITKAADPVAAYERCVKEFLGDE